MLLDGGNTTHDLTFECPSGCDGGSPYGKAHIRSIVHVICKRLRKSQTNRGKHFWGGSGRSLFHNNIIFRQLKRDEALPRRAD